MISLTNNLEGNIKMISANIPANFNFINREVIIKGETRCIVLYISNLSNEEYIENNVIHPLLFYIQSPINNVSSKTDYISKRVIASSNIKITQDVEVISDELKHGRCIVLIEKESSAVVCNTTKGSYRSITESNVEKAIKGGKEAFIESLEVNIALVQQGLKNNHLKMDRYIFGQENKADAVLIYLDDAIDSEVLQNIKKRLSSVKAQQILELGELSQLIERFPYSIFPQAKTSEKPTRVIADIMQGKAAILMEGVPYALIVPVVFLEFFQDVEDYGNRILNANFDRMLRIFAAIVVLILPSIYLILLTYNSELTPLNLFKIIVKSRLYIPLPPFVEILLIEILIEILREGGLRLPSPIGQTLSIVGGIILGQAATQAGIVSPTTLVVVAIAVICTFVIPNYDMALSIRLLRFFMIILTNMLGILGFLTGIQIITITLIRMDSFGIPYFSPVAPMRFKGLRDSLVSTKIENLSTRSVGFQINKDEKDQEEDNE